jgi:hypothetical protein
MESESKSDILQQAALRSLEKMMMKELQKNGMEGLTVRINSYKSERLSYRFEGPEDLIPKAEHIIKQLFQK